MFLYKTALISTQWGEKGVKIYIISNGFVNAELNFHPLSICLLNVLLFDKNAFIYVNIVTIINKI